MILLENGNRIILEAIQAAVDGKREALDITIADFDGVQFHISTPDANNKNLIQVSMQWRCFSELVKHGASVDLKRYYGPFLQAKAEENYDVTLLIDLANVPGDKAKLAETVSLLKRHVLASPFKKTFQAVEAGNANTNETIVISYRENEAFFIKPDQERVFVIFSVNFKDPGDQILAKVFLQEFADARKTMSNAPSVSFSAREPPGELQGVRGVKADVNTGFVSFVLFKNHITAKNADKTINAIETFRDYLHYHIKCSKAYLHTRMRNRVDTLLQVLNRARPAEFEKKEKKLISGKTFTRK